MRSIGARIERLPAAAAFAVYAVMGLALFGQPLLHPGAHECVCIGSTTDAGVYVWAFRWWPHALLHGLNPFVTHLLYAPQGIDLAHGTLVPGAALIFAPVTAIAGPLFAFDLAMLLSPVLAAFFAFLLCRRVTRAFWPSLVGGWLFGFSSFMLGQLVGHLNLTLVFLVPAIVHLVLRGLGGELSRRWFGVLMTAALVLQFSFSVEVFAALTMFGAVALAFAYAFGEAGLRAGLRALLGPIAVSYLAAIALVSPYLYYALQPGGARVLHWRTDLFSSDLLGFVVPTQITAVGGSDFLSTSLKFTAGYVEGGTYLGLPLLVIALLGALAARRRAAVKVMLGHLGRDRRVLAGRSPAPRRRDRNPVAVGGGRTIASPRADAPGSVHPVRRSDLCCARGDVAGSCQRQRRRPSGRLGAGGAGRGQPLAGDRTSLLAGNAQPPDAVHQRRLPPGDQPDGHGARAPSRDRRPEHAVERRGRPWLPDGQRLRDRA
jgi:hypothetical protein